MATGMARSAAEREEGSARRRLKGSLSKVVLGFGAAAGLYNLLFIVGVLNRFGFWLPPINFYATMLLVVLVMVFLHRPAFSTSPTDRVPWYDILLIVAVLASFGYTAIWGESVLKLRNIGTVGTKEMVLTYVGILALLEGGRRVVGVVYPAIVAFFMFYVIFSNYFPGFMNARGYNLYQLSYTLYASTDGLFGTPLQVASTIVIVFVIFASFLQGSGGGDFFMKISLALFGRFRGGPAKVAVVASSIFGTFSGSPSANVAGTGVVTIPLMKRIGYSPEFAGGVEAAASTGGQIMPPVMGIAAFIIAEWVGISYIEVAIAALFPAILYYVAIFTTVHLTAVKRGLVGISPAETPPAGPTLKEGWYYTLPIILIIVLLTVFRFQPEMSAIGAILLTLALSMLRKKTRMKPGNIIKALHGGIMGAAAPVVACGLAGILIGSITMTGAAVRLSHELVQISGGSVLILLLLAGATSLILAMGLSTVALYIVVAVLVAPALVESGVLPIAAHLFVFYFALLSFIIPPVAVAAFTAAAIANSEPMRTGIQAARLGIVLPLVPFAFVYDNALLLYGAPLDVLQAVVTSTIGTISVAAGIEGYLVRQANTVQRIMWIAGGLALYFAGWQTDLTGAALVMTATVWNIRQARAVAAFT